MVPFESYFITLSGSPDTAQIKHAPRWPQAASTGRLLPLLSALSVIYTTFLLASCNARAPAHEVSVQRHVCLHTSCRMAAASSNCSGAIWATCH